MKSTLKDLEEYFDSLHSYNADIRSDVEKILRESATLESENKVLSARKWETFHAVIQLNRQYEDLDEIYKTIHLVKQDQIVKMSKKIDDLKQTIAIKQEQLELLIRGDAAPESLVKPTCRCKAGGGNDGEGQLELTYSENKDISEVGAEVNPPNAGEVAEEPTTEEGDAGSMDHQAASNGGENESSLPDGFCHGREFIRNFEHLFLLKSYLADEQNTKKVANSLIRAHKKAFKAALARFLETAMKDLTAPFQDLRSEMLLSQGKVMAHFEVCLVSEIKPRTKLAICQRFRHLLNKFEKKFLPANKSGFFTKIFGRKKDVVVVKTEAELERDNLEIMQEMLRIEKARACDLAKCHKDAETRKELGSKMNLNLETRIQALNVAMENTELRIKNGELRFGEICKKQDSAIMELRMATHNLEFHIELQDLSFRYVSNGLEILNGGDDQPDHNPLGDVSELVERRETVVCDVDV